MAISSGQWDALWEILDEADAKDLEQIGTHISQQYSIMRQKAARRVLTQLDKGSRVRVSGSVKPKYLIGQQGTVDRLEGSKVHVKLDRGPTGKFRNGIVIFRSASALEVI